METKDITFIAITSAVGTIFYLATAPLIETMLPVIGCVIRPALYISFIMTRFHFNMKKLLWIAILSTFLYSLVIPCMINYISLPVSIVFVLIVAGFRTKMKPFWLTTIATVVAFGGLLLFTFIFSTNSTEWLLYMKYFLPVILVGALIGMIRQKLGKFNCVGCDMCNNPNAESYFKKKELSDRMEKESSCNSVTSTEKKDIDSKCQKICDEGERFE
ncbi:MAG: hypothetical protein KAH01_01070 [Caldisericia bacterium]|nr:hypothetical protein [Caldisericia bacterium]